ncbi:hypothetical protein [uncultured Sphingomonas sp.]|uniref:hypothetical protein n=1 Tax=uncultured Sphingomonas sp. TaxID=158754 RepID=UPI0035CC93E1
MTLAFLLAAATAAQPIAPAAAVWSTIGPPGGVTSVVGRVRTGGRIVADRFVADARLAKEERGAFAETPARRGSCAWASAARPFTRLRRFAGNGRLLWTWRADREEQALRLHATNAADCLSPSGGRLTVVSYRLAPGEEVTPLGNAVVAVDRRPGFADAKGIGSREADIIGWRRGAPSMLLVEMSDGGGNASMRQVAVP